MRRSIYAAILFAFPVVVQADSLVLNDLRAQNATLLTADELKQLLPNAKVTHHSEAGGNRNWRNEPNGKLVASADARGVGKVGGVVTGAPGTWHVGDNGTYCVTIEWPKRTENWCRYMFKLNDRYYGVKSVTDGASPAGEFRFSK